MERAEAAARHVCSKVVDAVAVENYMLNVRAHSATARVQSGTRERASSCPMLVFAGLCSLPASCW